MSGDSGPEFAWKNQQGWDHAVTPERYLWRWTESHLVPDRKTGEPKRVTSDYGLIPGGAYSELVRLLFAARVPVKVIEDSRQASAVVFSELVAQDLTA